MKIGYVLKRFPRASETFIAQEILELERRGAEVEVFSLRPSDTPVAHGWLRGLAAPVRRCDGVALSEAWKWLHARAATGAPARAAVERALRLAFRHPSRRGRHRLCEAVGLAQAAAGRGIQHLHAHFANEPAFVALLAGELLELSFSFTAHAKDIYARGPGRAVLAEQVGSAAFVVTVCEANRRHLERQLGPAAAKIRTLYNGVDLERLQPAAPSPASTARPHLLCVARLVEKKGIDLLLRAVAQLRDRGLELACTVVGEGPERPALERLRSELRLEATVELAGCLAHEEVISRMRAAGIFLLPCRVSGDGDRDALPTVLLEAMACGLPCLSTPVGGVAEIVRHRRTGLLVPRENPWALAAAIEELAASPSLRRRLGEAGRRRAARHFDRRRNVARLHGWLEAAAGGQLPAEAAPPPRLRLLEAGR
jgi:glycosyltransferase involved in cell wall biosynthesis